MVLLVPLLRRTQYRNGVRELLPDPEADLNMARAEI